MLTRTQRKLIEAIQTIRHCPFPLTEGRVGVPNEMFNTLVMRYDEMILEMSREECGKVVLDPGGTPFCSCCGRTL